MNLSSKVMRDIPWLCVAIAVVAAGAGGEELCSRGHSWWDRQRAECVPCTRCDPARRLAVHLPCELHRDTVCQSLYNVHIWPFTQDNENPLHNESVEYYDDVYYDSEVADSDDQWNLETSSLTLAASGCVVFFVVVLVLSLYHAKQWKVLKQALKSDNENPLHNESVEYYDDVYYDSEVADSDDQWNLETSSLTLAASGCVVFFVVVLVLSLYHAKQWKVLKQALKSDVQDLTAKLRLMEAGGETAAEPVVPTDHHLYCNIHVGKEALLGPNAGKKGLGNVYTQEKHPT